MIYAVIADTSHSGLSQNVNTCVVRIPLRVLHNRNNLLINRAKSLDRNTLSYYNVHIQTNNSYLKTERHCYPPFGV
jgi:hypothetical protein